MYAPCMAHTSSLRICYVAGTHLPLSRKPPESIKMSKPPMTSMNSSSVSSNNAVDALVAALVGLNMSPMTANALVTVIQAIAANDLSTPTALPPAHTSERADDVADPEANTDYNEAESGAIPAHTPPPPTGTSSATTPAPPNISPTLPSGNPSSTTLVPIAAGEVDARIDNPPPPTNAHSVGLPPSSVSYRGFPYEIPHASAEAPFYCVTKGKRVGVLSTWEDTSPQVTGVSGAIHSRCPSVEVGVARIHAAIERGNCQYLGV
ncbi:hypothetical protein EDB19DRAFT_1912071 [Suillus lakei]|nr:hypothetical protein EDB19DRAFT_1912071 [Suillus lakei]